MGNVTLPTPVFLAGGALCLLAGYFVGSVVGPDTPARTTATVTSYERAKSRLCLSGTAIEGQEGVGSDGALCGTWRPTSGVVPEPGDQFRFVSVVLDGKDSSGEARSGTVIYGDVVD